MQDKQDAIYQLDGNISVQKAVPFGLQHVLAMFVANIAPILIVGGVCKLGTAEIGSLVQTAMIIAGIGSLLQMFPIGPLGSRLPIIMGISFTFVSTFCVIGVKYGYGAILGAALIGGILEGILGLGARWWRRFVPPIVSASVVTAIGFSLLGIGANSFGGGYGNPHFGEAPYLIVGTITLLSCLVFHIRAHGFYKQLSVLFGLVVGYVAAYFYGMVDLSKLSTVSLFSLPQFQPYPLEFRPDAILSVFLIFLVSATETLGDTSALSVMGLGRLVKDREISGSIAVDGFVSALSSLFGCMPITSFSQNVGLVAMTHVVNRKAIASGAVLMILAGLFPALGVLLASLPEAVLGGCTLMMFGSIVVSGVRMLGDCGYSSRNMSIAALSLSIGIGFTQTPAIFKIFPTLIKSVFAENCVAVVFVVAFVLNLVFPAEEALQRDEWDAQAKEAAKVKK
ncbi:MAG: uracil-xanthine permease family protein [Succiniclasticum sp.]|jgi:xanthine permease